MLLRKTQYYLGQRPLGKLLYRVICVINNGPLSYKRRAENMSLNFELLSSSFKPFSEWSYPYLGDGCFQTRMRYCHLLLNPFPSGLTPLLEMVVSRPEWDILQVKSWTKFVLWLCQVSSSLLQNNKCWIISTNKTLFFSISSIQIWFHN